VFIDGEVEVFGAKSILSSVTLFITNPAHIIIGFSQVLCGENHADNRSSLIERSL
jgi:hypothetical protein